MKTIFIDSFVSKFRVNEREYECRFMQDKINILFGGETRKHENKTLNHIYINILYIVFVRMRRIIFMAKILRLDYTHNNIHIHT